MKQRSSALELVVNKVFIAYQDDRLSTIHHYAGPEGVRELTTLIVNQEMMSPETIEIVYDKVMKILDEIAINRNSNISKQYWEIYHRDLSHRLHGIDVFDK